MLWKNRRESSNVEDRRGMSARGGGIALGGGGLLIVVVLALLFGKDPNELLQQIDPGATGGGSQAGSQEGEYQSTPHEDELKQFVSVVLADTEDVWSAQFSKLGQQYETPTLVLFSGSVDSACGQASAAVGPFYCPGDHNLYLDLSFLDELQSRFNAYGDFPGAYVIAHEVGHHVQNLLGSMDKAQSLRARGVPNEGADGVSVRLELQADFYAGVWAHYAQASLGTLEPGDIEEALNAASAIGDDRLQQEGQGYAVPDSFTHGSSEQRMRWFKLGYETGDMSKGDTFSAKRL